MIALNMELRFRAPNNSGLDIFNRVTLFESCLNFGFARVIKNGSIILVKRHFPKLENLLNLILKFSLGFSADIGSPLGGHIFILFPLCSITSPLRAEFEGIPLD